MLRLNHLACYSVLFALGLTVPSLAAASTYDLAGEFSSSANPTGVWTYGYSAAPGGSVTRLSAQPSPQGWSPALADGWMRSGVQWLQVTKNLTTSTIGNVGDFTLGAGKIAFHPDNGGLSAVARFTAPESAIYSVQSSFKRIDTAGNSSAVYLHRNGAVVDSANLSGFGATRTFAGSVALCVGNVLDATVHRGPDGNFFNDFHQVDFSVTWVAADANCDGRADVADSDGDGVDDSRDVCQGWDDRVDPDLDGVPTGCDACPDDNPNDGDLDGLCASYDNCESAFNPDQDDLDGDGLGNICDTDWDGDGVEDGADLCLGFNDAADADRDGIPDGPDYYGEVCDVCPDDFENDADDDGLCESSDNCEDVYNDDQSDWDADGLGDVCDEDDDDDGVNDDQDACPEFDDSIDGDGDTVCDTADDCPSEAATGYDTDRDGCLDDTDGDGFTDDTDTFPLDPNEWDDSDGDGVGDNSDVCDGNDATGDDDLDGTCNDTDACFGDNSFGDTDGDLVCDDVDTCPTDPLDLDDDGDGVCDVVDACVGLANVDSDGDQVCDDLDICLGNDATGDDDFDSVCDGNDNCATVINSDQSDADGDGVGDACDDGDGDGVLDVNDNCPLDGNPDQGDSDWDSEGDVCDTDDDGDGDADTADNCPVIANADQADADRDGQGDACDGDDDGDSVADASDLCPGTPMSVAYDANGCSGTQFVDLTCNPGGTCSTHRNHGQYVSCVTRAASAAAKAGLLTSAEKASITRTAARDGCQ